MQWAYPYTVDPVVAEGANSWATSEATRRSMMANRGRDTRPELAVRSAVHRLGLRYRVNARPVRDLRRTADLVFRPARVAVFIDGCFWHSCPGHGAKPAANAEFWRSKLDATVERDRETRRALEDAGWAVLRFWEHESPDDVALAIKSQVDARRLAQC